MSIFNLVSTYYSPYKAKLLDELRHLKDEGIIDKAFPESLYLRGVVKTILWNRNVDTFKIEIAPITAKIRKPFNPQNIPVQ